MSKWLLGNKFFKEATLTDLYEQGYKMVDIDDLDECIVDYVNLNSIVLVKYDRCGNVSKAVSYKSGEGATRIY